MTTMWRRLAAGSVVAAVAALFAAAWFGAPEAPALRASAPVVVSTPAAVLPTAAAEAPVAAAPAADWRAGLRVLEIGRDPATGREAAVLRIRGATPSIHRRGDSLGIGMRLRAIAADHVEVERDRDVARLALDGSSGASRRLAPWRVLRHGATAQAPDAIVERDPDVVSGAQAGPTRSATDRAIERMRTGTR